MRAVNKVRIYLTEDERKMVNPALVRLAEALVAPWTHSNFSPKVWLESSMRACSQFREAQTSTALGFLLRKGVQLLANDWYRQTPRDYESWVAFNDSTTKAEWYAPLYPSQVAKRIGAGERFGEGRVIGEESVMINQKFGMIEAFERELFDDDQTGQIRQRASNLGASMIVTESFYTIRKFIGLQATLGDLVVPASRYTTINYLGAAVAAPWSKTLYGSALGNRLQTWAQLGINSLKNAHTISLVAEDPLRNRIIVSPDTLLFSPFDALTAPLLVAPPAGVPYYPGIPGQSGAKPFTGTTTAGEMPSAGFPGGFMSANPFIGLGIRPQMVRYAPDWFWAYGQAKRGIVMQNRDPLEIVQETPNSGDNFNFDSIRFRSRRRFEVDWVGGGSRFWVLGNPGYWNGAALTVDGDAGVQGAF